MARTRTALLEATGQCVERYGARRTTMIDIASRGKVAKATLYNHFRTKDDVLAALVEAEVSALAADCRAHAAEQPDAETGLAAALRHAATTIGASRPLRRVAEQEPDVMARLTTPGDGRTWQLAREAIGALLSTADLPAAAADVEVVLRWLTAQLLWPAGPEEAARGATVLARGLQSTTLAAAESPA
jgi:AcrR family transcriptional regulator